ncbi:MAG: NAD-dependent epimerase/dehydratase family protein [Acidobacteriota bacterium]|nr:NAD-dependent epimerase/dehydratase family protein [Acidobacteriota bacterium]
MNDGATQRSAFVTGATGCIGSALVSRLAGDGWRIVALVRNQARASFLTQWPNVELAEGELADSEKLIAAMRDCQTVFHLAAKVHAKPGTSAEEFEHDNVIGTRNVVAAAIENRAERFFQFSTVAVYGERDEVLDENSLPTPTTDYGRSKLEAEQIALASGLKTTVLRLPVVYGARDRGNVAKLIEAIRRNRYFIVGDGQNLKSMVAVENVVDAALLIASDERAIGQTFIVTDARPYSQLEIAATIAELFGKRQPIKLPRWPLVLAGKAADVIENLIGIELPISSDRVRKLSSNTVFRAAKIERELGFKPRASLREVLANNLWQFEKLPHR